MDKSYLDELSSKLTIEQLDTSLRTLGIISSLVERYDWNCRESDASDPSTKVVRIIKLCRKIESISWKRIKDTKRNDLSKIEQTGIRNVRNERVRKYEQIYDQTSNQPLKRLRLTYEEKIDNPVPIPIAEPIELKIVTRRCYICKKVTNIIHHFYDQMCPSCGDFNYLKRSQTADLKGKIVLVTGGRVKIGYETCLILLRAGALVIVTTRFPNDCLKRYQHEKDYEVWKENLHIYGLDLRFLDQVERFCQHINIHYQRLDILIQNAAQTIRRPVTYYSHLMENEGQISQDPQLKHFEIPTRAVDIGDVSSNDQINNPVALIPTSTQLCVHPEDISTLHNTHLFPEHRYDADHQQLDLRPVNSWVLQPDEVHTTELLEVTAINYLSPYILLTKLTPLLKSTTISHRTPGWVVMVSSMEGQFNREKTSYHAHTNSAKASLNMLTRTAASYYSNFNIYMNSVDTGWVTNENPIPLQEKLKPHHGDFHPPLDEIDGAARILDPIFKMINCGSNSKEYGVFYKDYLPTEW